MANEQANSQIERTTKQMCNVETKFKSLFCADSVVTDHKN